MLRKLTPLALGLAAAVDDSSFQGFTIENSLVDDKRVLEVFASYTDDAPATLNLFDCSITTADAGGFSHSDLNGMSGGSFQPLYTMDIPGLYDMSKDSYVTLQGQVGATASVAMDPNFGAATGATVPNLAGWYNSDPGTSLYPSGGTFKVGQFVVDEARTTTYQANDDVFFTFTCSIGYNGGPATEVHFGEDTAQWPEPSTAAEDVHLVLGDGGHADFRGSDNGVYNMLSAKGVSVNALFRSQDFLLHEKSVEFLKPEHNLEENALVHGTFMFGTYTAVRTMTGRLLHASVEAKETTQAANVALYENGELVQNLEGEGELLVDGISFEVSKGLVTIRTPSWKVQTTVVSEPRAYFVNLEMAPTGVSALQPVAPHGVIGQSFDGDGIAVDGATDKYNAKPGGVSTTTAQAEGAIEGTHEEYRMSSFFDTNFKYSRFDSSAAKPRDIKQLTGKKHAAWLTGHNGKGATAVMDKELR